LQGKFHMGSWGLIQFHVVSCSCIKYLAPNIAIDVGLAFGLMANDDHA